MTKEAINWNEVETITLFLLLFLLSIFIMLTAWGRVYVCKSEGSEDCSFATESFYPRAAHKYLH